MKASLNVTSFQSCRPARLMIGRMRDVRRLEVDQDLAQPLVAIAVLARGAHQRDAVVVAMGARGPDLGAVDPEAARHRLGTGADRGKVGARVGLAHADREEALAGGDARQDRLALLLAAEAQQQRAGLAVGDPVGAGGRAVAQQLLGDDVALEEALLRAAILLGPGDADPALLAELAAELRREGIPAGEAVLRLHLGQRLLEESADFDTQLFRFGRQVKRREFELGYGHWPSRRLDASSVSANPRPRN